MLVNILFIILSTVFADFFASFFIFSPKRCKFIEKSAIWIADFSMCYLLCNYFNRKILLVVFLLKFWEVLISVLINSNLIAIYYIITVTSISIRIPSNLFAITVIVAGHAITIYPILTFEIARSYLYAAPPITGYFSIACSWVRGVRVLKTE